jgi:hypothetical protein
MRDELFSKRDVFNAPQTIQPVFGTIGAGVFLTLFINIILGGIRVK